MKLSTLLCLTVLIAGTVFSSFAQPAQEEAPQKTRYVKVTKHLSNVYRELNNPKSDIIRPVKKGEFLELKVAGESWLKVTVDGKDGFFEAKNGKIVNSKLGPVIAFIMTVIVLLVCGGGIFFYIKKQKAAVTH